MHIFVQFYHFMKELGNKKYELLKKIRDDVVDFKKSPLYNFRVENKNLPVVGEGSHEAGIMFIGEAPGKNEAATGKPFCGAAGRVLTELIESIGLKREDVYITNIVKDRPPENRDPLPEEIKVYGSFLDRQIEIIQPKVIATLGRYSMAYIMEKYGLQNELKSISQIHGKVFDVPIAKQSRIPDGKAIGTRDLYYPEKIIPLYHPAVALYQGNIKNQLFKDFEVIKKTL
jgi:uracil-DNA glycosylase family 4